MTAASDPVAGTRLMLQRFTGGERWVHRSLGVLMLGCLASAAVLYVPDLSQLVGRRSLVVQVHLWCGFLLPVPLLLGFLLSPSFRADVRRLNRFRPGDWEWLRSSDRRSGRIAVGKFNAGQKLNASFTLGAVLVLLGTGTVMRFAWLWPLEWRTGATFVHDWLALAVAVVAVGHLYMAARDPVARAGMRTGSVPVDWARREHGAWAGADEPGTTPSGGPAPPR
ncbi:MAG: cytochrome b/b6 domain-containing protein [Candidatus Nanopelagicales bacterium]